MKGWWVVLGISCLLEHVFLPLELLTVEKISFDSSASRYGHRLNPLLEKQEFAYSYNLFKYLYLQNVNKVVKQHGDIPKIIHQIWMGKPIPKQLKLLCNTWQGHEGWSYRLWDERAIMSLGLANEDLFLASEDWGEKSDLARLEILERFGGVYVDVDFECLHFLHLEELCAQYDVIIGCEPVEDMPKVGNAFLACAPHHPFVQSLQKKVRESFAKNCMSDPIEKTGPAFLTACVLADFCLLEGGIILPPTYLYPVSWGDDIASLDQHWDQFIYPETIGIHYWTRSWQDAPFWGRLSRIRNGGSSREMTSCVPLVEENFNY